MKTYSIDQSFIDFTTPKFGVRVREGFCRTIELTSMGWEEYGEEIPLPISAAALDLGQISDSGDLAGTVSEYEEISAVGSHEDRRELRRLLEGRIDLGTALH
jgi:hypothetical protein